MALFGKKTEDKKAAKPAAKKEVKKVTKKATKKAPAKTAGKNKITAETVLLRPHVTEKAAQLTAQGVYTFDIAPRATKYSVAKAVSAVYGVTPKKVAVVNTVGKRKRLRTRRGFGTRAAGKKAYVYLNEGDRIEFSS